MSDPPLTPTIDEAEFTEDGNLEHDPPRTVLPPPFASLVSLATTTSSLGLRIGGFVGLTALHIARVGTLVGFDVSRALIESLSSREDDYRLALAGSETPEVVTESFLDSALSILARSITTTSSWVSAGFELGSNGLTTGLATAQFFLSALHAILGHSESSRAIAAIILLFRREIRDPEQNSKGEYANLIDFIIGGLAFILLQRWCDTDTRKAWTDEGVVEEIYEAIVELKGDGTRRVRQDNAVSDGEPAVDRTDHNQSETIWSTDGGVMTPNDDDTYFSDSPSAESIAKVLERSKKVSMEPNEKSFQASQNPQTPDGVSKMSVDFPGVVNDTPSCSRQTPVRKALRQSKPVGRLVNFWDQDRVHALADEELLSLPAQPVDDDQEDLDPLHPQNQHNSKADAALPMINSLHRFAKFAVASYGKRFLSFVGVWQEDLALCPHLDDTPEHQFFSTYIDLPSSSVLLSSYVDAKGIRTTPNDDHGVPLVHYISLDHQTKAVVLTIRGTLGFEDLLTDSICDYDKLHWEGEMYRVHKGILASARRLITLHDCRVITSIREALVEHDGYGLVLCGHSLGGAVAAVLSVLLAQTNESSTPFGLEYVTADRSFGNKISLPSQRPIHAYTYGCAACFAPDLQRATMGLITTVIHGQDFIPYLSLGTLRDFQSMALSFKADSHDAKPEFLRRLQQRVLVAFRKHSGLDALQDRVMGIWQGRRSSEEQEAEIPLDADSIRADVKGESQESDVDYWSLIALKTLRAHQLSDKLVPPGEIFVIDSKTLSDGEVDMLSEGEGEAVDEDPLSSQPPSPSSHTSFIELRSGKKHSFARLTLTHIHDVERRFGELRFGPSMFADHFPGRYERVLKLLERSAFTEEDQVC